MSEVDARNAMSSWVYTKRAACKKHRGPWDLMPMLDVHFEDGYRELVMFGEREAIPPAVAEMRERREREGMSTRIRTVAVLADVVFKEYAPEEAPDLEDSRGVVHAARERGDLNVLEALAVTVIDAKGAVHATRSSPTATTTPASRRSAS